MSRTLPYLAELQPEFFVEVSPQLAEERGLENGGWATVVTARAAVEARVLVTERIRPLRLKGGRVVHQIGIPYHWGERGISTGDSANDLLGVVHGRRTPTSRRARPRPATSGPAAVRAGRSWWSSSRSTACAPAIKSGSRPGRRPGPVETE